MTGVKIREEKTTGGVLVDGDYRPHPDAFSAAPVPVAKPVTETTTTTVTTTVTVTTLPAGVKRKVRVHGKWLGEQENVIAIDAAGHYNNYSNVVINGPSELKYNKDEWWCGKRGAVWIATTAEIVCTKTVLAVS